MPLSRPPAEALISPGAPRVERLGDPNSRLNVPWKDPCALDHVLKVIGEPSRACHCVAMTTQASESSRRFMSCQDTNVSQKRAPLPSVVSRVPGREGMTVDLCQPFSTCI